MKNHKNCKTRIIFKNFRLPLSFETFLSFQFLYKGEIIEENEVLVPQNYKSLAFSLYKSRIHTIFPLQILKVQFC